ncbi:MAG: ECF transporter S component [Tepidanaerobacteraceae bacterium]|nr:ECF transporter S component [Tepidanaerobacteraceae bacterium]
MSKFLNRFSPFDLIIISLLSACGIAIKPFVRLLTQMAVGTFIPAGTVAGIIYMIWIVLACAIVRKRGTALLVGIVQSVLVVAFDMLGNRGIANLLTYVVPVIVMELGMLLIPGYVYSMLTGFLAGMLVNATGSLVVGAVFMRMPMIPLMVSTMVGGISGGIGGVIGYRLAEIVRMFKKTESY